MTTDISGEIEGKRAVKDNPLAVCLSDGDEPISSDNPLPIYDIDNNNRSSLNTLFGEKQVGIRKPTIAAQFQYGYPVDAADTEELNGGSISFSESMLVVSTGTSSNGSARINNRRALRYIAGHEAYLFFTGVYTEGVDNSYQRAGIFDSANGFFIGYEGSTFSVTRRRDGVDTSNAIDLSLVFEDGSFDPTKGNIYKISFGYLGFATINFEVLCPDGCYRLIHKIKYPNTSTVTHILNTNLQPRAEVSNTGNTTDLVFKSGSFTAGIVNGGGADPSSRRFTFDSTAQTITAGTLTVITFRSKSTFNSLTNYIESMLTLLSFNTDLSKSSLWELEKNCTITNTPTWTDVDTANSTIEYSTDAVVTQGSGSLEFSIPLGKIDRELISNLEEQNISLLPGDTITLFIVTPGGTNGTYDLSFRWKELF